MRAKRRSFRAYLVEPFKQIRFGLHVAAVSLAFTVLIGVLVARGFYEQYEQVIEIFRVAETDIADLVVNEVFIRNGSVIALTLMGFVATMLFVVVRRTHRMYGPMVSIMRFVSELSRGNYAVRIHVRGKDDFQGLVGRLNDLAETLHKRHGASVAQNGDPSESGLDALDSRLRDLEEGVVVVNDPHASGKNPPKAS